MEWDGHAYLDVYVDGNVPADEPVRIPPFSTEKPAKVTPVPLNFSKPSLWVGEWAGDDAEASIIVTRDGLFDVVLREKDARGNEQSSETDGVGINRAGCSRTRLRQRLRAVVQVRRPQQAYRR